MSTPAPHSPATPPMGRPGGRQLPPLHQARVLESFDAPLNMRRVVLGLPEGSGFTYKPGQAVVLLIPTETEEMARRDYTIRAAEGDTITLDILKHGETPGPLWALGAKPGDTIAFRGPRGGTWLDPEADWHLITGDETCIPAIQHMLETAKPGAKIHVLLEIDGPEARFALETAADLSLTWIERGGAPAGPSDLMVEALAAFPLPEGRGRSILIGETSNVRRQRRLLIDGGVDKTQVYSEGYWRPGRLGGHDHVDD